MMDDLHLIEREVFGVYDEDDLWERDTELAWAAGFFDGEGSVSPRFDKRPGRKPALNLDIEQTDERPLRRFHKAVGRGNITFRPARALTRKPLYRLYMADADTRAVMELLWPYLSEPKREQFNAARRAIGEIP